MMIYTEKLYETVERNPQNFALQLAARKIEHMLDAIERYPDSELRTKSQCESIACNALRVSGIGQSRPYDPEPA